MMKNDKLFDIKMKERFKKEVIKVPDDIGAAFNKTLDRIKNQGSDMRVKPMKGNKVWAAAAAVAGVLMITMQTTFAQDLVSDIIKSLSLNNITIFENKPFVWEDRKVPEAAKGKVFDQNGNVIDIITQDNENQMYNANGERVLGIEEDGTLLTEEVLSQGMEESLLINDVSQLNKYVCFEIKLPAYLPSGFVFDQAEFYKLDDGTINDKGCSLSFINPQTGETIYLSQSYICEETSGETSFENIEKVKVNGAQAILGDEGIVWEEKGVRYLMYTYSLGRGESIKIAESME